METSELTFVAAILGASAALLGYAEFRRLLHGAVDDRYGEWGRFQARVARLPSFGARLRYRLHHGLAFFFCHGVHDLLHLTSGLAFDLFVVFAFLSPFWRAVYFDDWNPTLAAAIALAGACVYTFWKLRLGLQSCRVHVWSEQTSRCERCGEPHARADEQEGLKKTGKPAVRQAPEPPKGRTGWHRLWERRLERLTERLASEPEQVPRPAG